MEFQDREIVCVKCGKIIIFTAKGQEFFKEKGFVDPRQCKECRNKRDVANGTVKPKAGGYLGKGIFESNKKNYDDDNGE